MMIVKNILLRVCGIVGKEWRKESFSLNFFCKQTLESWKLFLQNLTKLINLMVYIVRLLNGTFEGTKYFCIWNDRIYRRCFLEPKQQIGVSPFSSLFFWFYFQLYVWNRNALKLFTSFEHAEFPNICFPFF